MLILILMQSVLLAGLFGLVMYWRVEAAGRARTQKSLEAMRGQAVERLQAMVLQLQRELAEMKDQDRPVESTTHVVGEHAPALTLAKRSKALKMIRRGEAPETVSAALGVPKSQIRLLVKVQGLLDPH
jgi:hypothetical protein